MADLVEMVATLFTAPVQACLIAEKGHRKVWLSWIEGVVKIASDAGLKEPALLAALISKELDRAPVLKMDAQIDVGLTMRIETVKKKEGGAELSVGVGPFQGGGSFSFMSQNTQESVLNARATYRLASTSQTSLSEFLRSIGHDPKDLPALTAASETLKKIS